MPRTVTPSPIHLAVLAGLVALAASGPARAQDVTSLVTVDGRCTRMVIPGDDMTAVCTTKLVNANLEGGRANFAYLAQRQGRKPVAVTFGGPGTSQVKAADGTVTQPVDLVTVNRGEGPEAVKAVGSCTFADPRRKGTVIACKAETDRGKFDAAFATSGKTPVVLDPRKP